MRRLGANCTASRRSRPDRAKGEVDASYRRIHLDDVRVAAVWLTLQIIVRQPHEAGAVAGKTAVYGTSKLAPEAVGYTGPGRARGSSRRRRPGGRREAPGSALPPPCSALSIAAAASPRPAAATRRPTVGYEVVERPLEPARLGRASSSAETDRSSGPVEDDRPHLVREHVGVDLAEHGPVRKADVGQLSSPSAWRMASISRATFSLPRKGSMPSASAERRGRRRPSSSRETDCHWASVLRCGFEAGELLDVVVAQQGRALADAARVEANEVEAILDIARRRRRPPAQEVDAGAAGPARVHQQRADAVRRVPRPLANQGKVDLPSGRDSRNRAEPPASRTRTIRRKTSSGLPVPLERQNGGWEGDQGESDECGHPDRKSLRPHHRIQLTGGSP